MSVVSKMIRKASSPWMLLALCAVNLLVMHYHFVSAGDIEDELEFTAYFDNFTGIAIDVVVVFLLSCLLCLKRMKLALSITFFNFLLDVLQPDIWSFLPSLPYVVCCWAGRNLV